MGSRECDKGTKAHRGLVTNLGAEVGRERVHSETQDREFHGLCSIFPKCPAWCWSPWLLFSHSWLGRLLKGPALKICPGGSFRFSHCVSRWPGGTVDKGSLKDLTLMESKRLRCPQILPEHNVFAARNRPAWVRKAPRGEAGLWLLGRT